MTENYCTRLSTNIFVQYSVEEVPESECGLEVMCSGSDVVLVWFDWR